jgi:hypothetical protein
MNIQEFELRSYKREIESLKKEYLEFASLNKEEKNLTLFSLHTSNRVHLAVVGLCSLVEVTLFECVQEIEKDQKFKLDDINGAGITRLQKYLSKTGTIKFGEIQAWADFKNIYVLRNTFIHSYGGMIESKQIDEAKKSIRLLKLCDQKLVVGNRRIRLDIETLEKFHEIFEKVIYEIQKNT